MTVLPPLAVYLHVPWCVRKCPYCDFNSHAHSGELPETEWLQRIGEDLTEALADAGDRTVASVFFGGGTPSLLSPATVAATLELLADRLPLATDLEITLEANPGTVDAARFRGFRAAGINRLSLGVQSFSDRALAALGRIHGGEEAREAVAAAGAAGFERINLDLMHGLPGQSVEEALADLTQAIALGVDHLSWYQLTIEANTEFYARPPRLPEEAILAEIEDLGSERLAAAGFERYEVSAWARPGQASRHNLNYWTFGDYLGLGPGAHGKSSRRTTDGGLEVVRSRHTRSPRDWLQSRPGPRAKREPVARSALPEEFMLNALRLIDGVESSLFEAHTGLPLAVIEGELTALREEGLLEPDRIATTDLGLRFLDRVVGRFMPAPTGPLQTRR